MRSCGIRSARGGGQERQFLGDGFLRPSHHRRPPSGCAIGVQRAHDEHNASDPELQVRVRIGIHVGEVSEREGLLYGQAVHVAARSRPRPPAVRSSYPMRFGSKLSRERNGGSSTRTVLAQGVRRAVAVVRGVPGPGRAAAAAGVMPPPLTPMIGRDSEQANLRRAVDEALAGRGGLALVAGEAGVGSPASRRDRR